MLRLVDKVYQRRTSKFIKLMPLIELKRETRNCLKITMSPVRINSLLRQRHQRVRTPISTIREVSSSITNQMVVVLILSTIKVRLATGIECTITTRLLLSKR